MEEATLLTPLALTTITGEAMIKGIPYELKKFIANAQEKCVKGDVISEKIINDDTIKVVKCETETIYGNVIHVVNNFGTVTTDEYIKLTTKVKNSNKGRLPKAKPKKQREVQGTGECFNSQTTVVIKTEFPDPKDPKKIKIYKIKVFLTGKCVIPGIMKEDTSDAVGPLNEVKDYVCHIEEKDNNVDVSDIKVTMLNYKNRLAKNTEDKAIFKFKKSVVAQYIEKIKKDKLDGHNFIHWLRYNFDKNSNIQFFYIDNPEKIKDMLVNGEKIKKKSTRTQEKYYKEKYDNCNKCSCIVYPNGKLNFNACSGRDITEKALQFLENFFSKHVDCIYDSTPVPKKDVDDDSDSDSDSD